MMGHWVKHDLLIVNSVLFNESYGSDWVAEIIDCYNWNRAYVRFYFYPVQYSVTLSLYSKLLL